MDGILDRKGLCKNKNTRSTRSVQVYFLTRNSIHKKIILRLLTFEEMGASYT